MKEIGIVVPVIISIRDNKTYEVVSFDGQETITPEHGFDLTRWTRAELCYDHNRKEMYNNKTTDIKIKPEIGSIGKYFVNVINKDTNEIYMQQFPITEEQKIKEHCYKEIFNSLFNTIPKIDIDMMILNGEIKPDVFMFRNIAAYENVSCRMIVQFEFKREK